MTSTSKYQVRRIADPVHGTIGLSELETELLSTQAFQRLRNVKQLGLAHLVFPGADYSRLSHSLGVNHVTGRILNSLVDNTGQEITDAEYELYRLAGLLHEIGHYPSLIRLRTRFLRFTETSPNRCCSSIPKDQLMGKHSSFPMTEAARH